MSQVFTVIAAVWVTSGATVMILFALDERSHRRTRHAASPASAKVHRHVDGALA